MEVEEVPQSKPLPGMVPNSAGGFTWAVDDMRRLRRFLCLGSEGGTYYIREKKLGKENAQCISRLIGSGRGREVVSEILDFSLQGRAAKQDPIIFALALCARGDDKETKRVAYEALNKVCRIPTHLFAFVDYCQGLSQGGTGWGRAQRRAVQAWYNEKKGKPLAIAVTKYQQRGGWSHLDLLRLCHLVPANEGVGCVCRYVVKGIDVCREGFSGKGDAEVDEILVFLEAVEAAKSTNEPTVVTFIQENGLVREHVPTVHLNSTAVWGALLENMPMTAMIRNLGKMSSIGLLKPLSPQAALVCNRLRDTSLLSKARIHPFNVLVALKTYQSGHGDKGNLRWDPNSTVCDALEEAFYKSFKFVQSTGKRFLLALDVSGSMSSGILGSAVVTAREASAAMAMVTARTEANYHIVGFSSQLVPVNINSKMSLKDVLTTIERVPMGGTDCAQPMIYAKKKRLEVDVFIVYTDCETWAGTVYPTHRHIYPLSSPFF
jgi:60 kDa SS-A/Ro ribonucleoprotein